MQVYRADQKRKKKEEKGDGRQETEEQESGQSVYRESGTGHWRGLEIETNLTKQRWIENSPSASVDF